jgi:hypothetical protein
MDEVVRIEPLEAEPGLIKRVAKSGAHSLKAPAGAELPLGS